MKRIVSIIAVISIIASTSCNKDQESQTHPKTIDLPAKASEVISASNSFGINLFSVTAVEENANMMLSPLSASTALTMLLNGCGTNTYEQIRDMLGYQGLTLEEINATHQSLVNQLLNADPDVSLALANAVFYRQDFPFKASFLELMDTTFDAEVTGLDFYSPAALESINGWASDHTNGKITKVLTEIEPMSVMFLMNALYFKGTWTYQFKPENTMGATFHAAGGVDVVVDMMHEKMDAKFCSADNWQALELTYGNTNFSMIIVLPFASVELNEFITDFDPEDWQEIAEMIDTAELTEALDIYLPKFKFEYEKELNDQLKALGMIDAFRDDYGADLSGICDQSYLFVQFVKQNTFIEVNEEGTEAAAVTTIGIGYNSINEFAANRPFIFAIRERTTNALLFIGKVDNPLE